MQRQQELQPAPGHHDGADEPQQSLFSWAEFMAEQVKPKGRSPQVSPCSSGLFWSRRRRPKRCPDKGAAHVPTTRRQDDNKGEERWQESTCMTADGFQTRR